MKKQRKNMLAYCPLDLPRVSVNENLINDLIDRYDPGHHDGIWSTLPLLGRVNSQNDFFNAAEFEKAWERRYQANGEVFLNEKFYDLLLPIFKQFEHLPLKVTHAQILRANKNVPKHYDMKHKNKQFIDDYPEINYEPNGFKILLNKTAEPSFFVCKDFNSEPVYTSLPAESNTFVINEKTFPHGSTFIKNKCIVSIFGLVNIDEADSLINRSLEKYKKYSISF